MSDLDKLIAAVEAGDEPALYSALRAIASAARDKGEYWPAHDATKAFDGSLDAVLRLHDALLPGWHVAEISEAAFPLDHDGKHWLVAVAERAGKGLSEANGPTMARAWLLAILRALKASDFK